MKAILEFNLPEDSCEFNSAKNGVEYQIILQELDEQMRTKLKYTELSKKEAILLESLRELLYNSLESRGVKLWE